MQAVWLNGIFFPFKRLVFYFWCLLLAINRIFTMAKFLFQERLCRIHLFDETPFSNWFDVEQDTKWSKNFQDISLCWKITTKHMHWEVIKEQESFREGLLCILSSSEYVMLPSNSRAKYRRLRQFGTEMKK